MNYATTFIDFMFHEGNLHFLNVYCLFSKKKVFLLSEFHFSRSDFKISQNAYQPFFHLHHKQYPRHFFNEIYVERQILGLDLKINTINFC